MFPSGKKTGRSSTGSSYLALCWCFMWTLWENFSFIFKANFLNFEWTL